jgi:cold shock CspA family protein
MNDTLKIVFRDMAPSPSVVERIRRRVANLEKTFGRIQQCRVVISSSHRSQRKGRLYQVAVDVDVPGGNVVVNRRHNDRAAHEDIAAAIRDGFDAARRRLASFARKRRDETKVHRVPPHGRVAKLFPRKGYGFIEAPDGAQIYFHRNSVLGDAFRRLEVGARVRFVVHPDESPNGPQASSVRPIGKHTLPDVDEI